MFASFAFTSGFAPWPLSHTCVCVCVCGALMWATARRELILFPPTGEINLLRVARALNALRVQSGQQNPQQNSTKFQ